MKKLNIYCTLAFLVLAISLFLPAISYAVPAAPSSTCAISAAVLSVQKTKTNIAGQGLPSREDFYYYLVKLKIESSVIYQQDPGGYNSCDYYINKELDSILSLTEYDKLPINAGQNINARIHFDGDEWFNGNYLSDVKITSINTTNLTSRYSQNIYFGIKNSSVSTLQSDLSNDSSIYPEKLVTGYFGSLTLRAVKRFQVKYGIIQTGYVGPLTRAKLNELYGSQ